MKKYRNAERTKQWIRQAFIQLLSEKKSIDKITINELSERADITKTTFYYHYADIYAVAEEFENALIAELNDTIDKINKENPSDYSAYIKRILSFIKENEANYKLAANASDMAIFANKLKSIFAKKIADMATTWGFSSDYERRSVQVYFLGSACVDTVVRYLKGGLCSSLDLVGDVIIEATDKLKDDKRQVGKVMSGNYNTTLQREM